MASIFTVYWWFEKDFAGRTLLSIGGLHIKTSEKSTISQENPQRPCVWCARGTFSPSGMLDGIEELFRIKERR